MLLYFYKSLILLAIPLIFNFYLYIIEYTYLHCKKFFQSVLIFIPVQNQKDSFHIIFKEKKDMPEDHGRFADDPSKKNLFYLIAQGQLWANMSDLYGSFNDVITK